MKKYGTLLFILFLSTNLYADSVGIQQGEANYDWQDCFTNRLNDCVNACATSSDIDCKENCVSLSRDKCIAEGYNPPSNID